MVVLLARTPSIPAIPAGPRWIFVLVVCSVGLYEEDYVAADMLLL